MGVNNVVWRKQTIDADSMNEILTHLCYYDKRNPDCVMDDEELKEYQEIKERKAKKANKAGKNIESCYCDSCFNGNTKLAEKLLNYVKLK